MGGRGSSSGGGGGARGSFSETWTTPAGNKISVKIGPETTRFKDDWGGLHESKTGRLEVKSFKFNGESKKAEFGTMQHKDKIIFELNGKDAAVAMPQSLQKNIEDFYKQRFQKEAKVDEKLREYELRMKRANGRRGYTW